MSTKRVIIFGSWLLTVAAACGLGAAIAQQTPPKDNKGLDAQIVSTIDLGPDIPGLQLRLRKITFESDGVAGIHSHKERPAFAYVLEGTLTEFRDGGYTKTYGPGSVITESRDVTHWAENKSGSKVVLVGVDIVKP